MQDALNAATSWGEEEPHRVRYSTVYPAVVECLRHLTGNTWDAYKDYRTWWDEHEEDFEMRDSDEP